MNKNCITKQDLLNRNIEGKQGIWFTPAKRESSQEYHIPDDDWWAYTALRFAKGIEGAYNFFDAEVVDPVTNADNHLFKFIDKYCEFDENGKLLSAFGEPNEPGTPCDIFGQSIDGCWQFLTGTGMKEISRRDKNHAYGIYLEENNDYSLFVLLYYKNQAKFYTLNYDDALIYYLPKPEYEKFLSEEYIKEANIDWLVYRLHMAALKHFFINMAYTKVFDVDLSFKGEMSLMDAVEFVKLNHDIRYHNYERGGRYMLPDGWKKYGQGFTNKKGEQIS